MQEEARWNLYRSTSLGIIAKTKLRRHRTSRREYRFALRREEEIRAIEAAEGAAHAQQGRNSDAEYIGEAQIHHPGGREEADQALLPPPVDLEEYTVARRRYGPGACEEGMDASRHELPR